MSIAIGFGPLAALNGLKPMEGVIFGAVVIAAPRETDIPKLIVIKAVQGTAALMTLVSLDHRGGH